jgi:glycosyltransferase involved in cell wall biosynthesis
MPLISVIIPNYNHGVYLKERIDSVLKQTCQDFEIIILDDCSQDNSREIIESYRSDSRINAVIYNESNSGNTFKQWEKGIEMAQGKYIWIAESDDWCEPTLLETLISAFNKFPGLVLSYVQSYYIVEPNRIKWISEQPELEKTVAGRDFIKKYLVQGNAIFNASMAMFKKTAYYQINNSYTNYKFCGDWLFWSEIAKNGNVFISGRVLNYFRNHHADVSGKVYANGLNFVEELQVLFSFFDERLITDREFFEALDGKHLRYQQLKNNFSKEMVSTVETLFYDDIRTKKFKSAITGSYRKTILKQRIRNYLEKIGL